MSDRGLLCNCLRTKEFHHRVVPLRKPGASQCLIDLSAYSSITPRPECCRSKRRREYVASQPTDYPSHVCELSLRVLCIIFLRFRQLSDAASRIVGVMYVLPHVLKYIVCAHMYACVRTHLSHSLFSLSVSLSVSLSASISVSLSTCVHI